jgi:capsid protein
VTEEYSERTFWAEAEQEAVERYHVDGEVIIEWFPQADGTMEFRFVEPEWLKTPPQYAGDPRFSFGVETAPGDVNTVVAYWILRDPQNPASLERVPAEYTSHWKANVRRAAKRGLPTFYSVRENLERAEKLLRNTGTLAQIAATFAVIREHSGPVAGAESMRQSLTQSAGTDPRTGADRRVQTYEPGGVIDISPGMKMNVAPANLNTAGYMETHAAELRAVAACLCWPEYLVSADASNGNYSSLKVAESPTVKDSKRNQATWARRFAGAKYRGKRIIDPPVMLRVIEWAVTCRRLPPEALTQVRVIATPPVLEVRDPIQTVSVQERRLVMGVTSRRAICTENGDDYEQVQRDLANEPQTPEGGKAKGQTVKDSPGVDAETGPAADPGSQADEQANGTANGNGNGRERAGAIPFWLGKARLGGGWLRRRGG